MATPPLRASSRDHPVDGSVDLPFAIREPGKPGTRRRSLFLSLAHSLCAGLSLSLPSLSLPFCVDVFSTRLGIATLPTRRFPATFWSVSTVYAWAKRALSTHTYTHARLCWCNVARRVRFFTHAQNQQCINAEDLAGSKLNKKIYLDYLDYVSKLQLRIKFSYTYTHIRK